MTTPKELFAQIDTLDADAVIGHFADDATMVFGNNEPLFGREAILAGNRHFLTAIKGLRHDIVREWTLAETSIVVTDVTYTRHDDKRVTIPAASIWRVGGDGLITDYRVYFDPGPVFAQ
ncbi:MAG TPA: nuclear transport factor 2 family protein [Amycolatopsis sp.]|nr:nuclear transport factor 2 family protein [Amycolatopsis sp.]